MDDLAEFKQTYLQECEELLVDLESRLTALRDSEGDDEALNAAFRAIHSIKGGAGAFGFTRLVGFAHVFETVLDQMREHRLEASSANIALLIRAGDVLSDLVAAVQADRPAADDLGLDLQEKLHELAGTTPGEDEGEDPLDGIDFDPPPRTDPTPEPAPSAAMREVGISFAPTPRLFHRANDPLILIRELKSLGMLETEVDCSSLPALEDMEADGAYLTWRFRLTTSAAADDIRQVFEFVLDDCRVEIDDCQRSELAPPIPGEIAAPTTQPEATSVGSAAATAPKKPPASIRVDLERIDRLVNMVGELVITQAMLSEQIGQLAIKEKASLLHGIEALALQIRDLQESVMSIRTQPVKPVFSRMARLVRELSCSLDKEAQLFVAGETTEVDRTIIEEISDPLMHMIRNSMDHGIETPVERERAGKPRGGTIRLSAAHRNGKIVISVSDDGRGIDRAKVLAKAIDKGIVAPDDCPSDDEIDAMILLPGFSTADQISNVSGRGVGMDVVVRKIHDMGGRIGITSVPGESTEFSLTLPLTLAVLDGMIIRVGSALYIIPITSIVETQRPQRDAVHQVASGGDVLAIRGGFIKLVHLAEQFGGESPAARPHDQLVVVVETGDRGPIGLVVDELVGQQQVVVKSLEANYRRVEGVAGATILGNGMVALILDVDGVHAMSQHAPSAARAIGAREPAGMPP